VRGLLSGGARVKGGERAVEHREAGVAGLEVIGEIRRDSARTVPRKLEKGTIEARSDVEILVIAHAWHQGSLIEHAGGSKKEMVPVGSLVTTVD
jgi:hypothetical protein